MKYNLRKLIRNSAWDFINQLIKLDIIQLDDAVREVIEMNEACYIYAFAIYVEGAPIEELTQGIVQTKDAYYIYLFAIYVKGAPIDKLAQGMIRTKNAEWIFYFARYIEGAPIEMLVNGLLELKSYFWIGLILSTISTQNSNCEKNSELEKYALEHKEEILAVIEECTNIDILQRIKLELKIDSLIHYVDQLIQKLIMLSQNQESNTMNLSEEELLEYLEQLYNAGDIEAIGENRDLFASLFQDNVKSSRKRTLENKTEQ